MLQVFNKERISRVETIVVYQDKSGRGTCKHNFAQFLFSTNGSENGGINGIKEAFIDFMFPWRVGVARSDNEAKRWTIGEVACANANASNVFPAPGTEKKAAFG